MLLKQILVTSSSLLPVGMFPLHILSFVLELYVFSCFTEIWRNVYMNFDHVLFSSKIQRSCLNISGASLSVVLYYNDNQLSSAPDPASSERLWSHERKQSTLWKCLRVQQKSASMVWSMQPSQKPVSQPLQFSKLFQLVGDICYSEISILKQRFQSPDLVTPLYF